MSKVILVIDDSASVRQLVGITLRGAGYTVIEAVDGKDGLQKLTDQKFSLVISDVNMPNMDGISFVKEMKKTDKHKFTPVIMLTTESIDEKKQQGKDAGAKAWIIKPFNPDKLLQVVSMLIM